MSNEIAKLVNPEEPFEGLWHQSDYKPLEPAMAETMMKATVESSRVVQGLLWCEPIWVGLLAPLILLPGQFVPLLLQPIIVGSLPLFWLLRLLLQRRITQRTPLDWLLGLLVLLIPLGIWVSPDTAVSWQAGGYLLLGIALYVAIVNWPVTRQHPWLIGVTICVIGLGLAIMTPSMLSSAPRKLFDNDAFKATLQNTQSDDMETINPNVLAGGLAFALPFLLALALHTHLLSRKSVELSQKYSGVALALLCGVLTIGVAFVIVLTQSRGAYVGSAIACWLVLLLRWPRSWPILLLAILAAAAGGYWFGVDQLLDQSAFENSINSYEGRTEIWQRGVTILFEFPFTGIGIGTFGELIPHFYPYNLYVSSVTIPHAHNMFLQIGADLGLVGVAAFIGIVVALFGMFGRTYISQRSAPTQLNRALAIGSIGALTVYLVHGLFDSVLWGTKLSFMPWLLMGLAVLLPKEEAKKQRKRRDGRRRQQTSLEELDF